MKFDKPRILPLGQQALIVEFGDSISQELNDLAISLSEFLERNPFPGFIEAAPAYSSTYVGFDPQGVRADLSPTKTTFDIVSEFLRNAFSSIHHVCRSTGITHEIPVFFGGDDGPDLAFVADQRKCSEGEIIRVFTSSVYRVYMLGFLPGFLYLGELDARIETPRRETPRTKVAKGSVGIAGQQTGIYPLESPGGWQLIGRTDVDIFLPDSVPPCRVNAGDLVRFTIA